MSRSKFLRLGPSVQRVRGVSAYIHLSLLRQLVINVVTGTPFLDERAFEALGGVPRIVVIDNLKSGVLKANLYEPELNPVYAAFEKHAFSLKSRKGTFSQR